MKDGKFAGRGKNDAPLVDSTLHVGLSGFQKSEMECRVCWKLSMFGLQKKAKLQLIDWKLDISTFPKKRNCMSGFM